MTKVNTANELHVRLSTDHRQVRKAFTVLQKQGARGNTAIQDDQKRLLVVAQQVKITLSESVRQSAVFNI